MRVYHFTCRRLSHYILTVLSERTALCIYMYYQFQIRFIPTYAIGRTLFILIMQQHTKDFNYFYCRMSLMRIFFFKTAYFFGLITCPIIAYITAMNPFPAKYILQAFRSSEMYDFQKMLMQNLNEIST